MGRNFFFSFYSCNFYRPQPHAAPVLCAMRVLAILLLIGAACALASAHEGVCSTTARTAQEFSTAGIQADQSGRSADAIANFKRATEIAPQDPNGWENLGVGYLRQGMRLGKGGGMQAFAASRQALLQAKSLAIEQGRHNDVLTISQNLQDLSTTMNVMGLPPWESSEGGQQGGSIPSENTNMGLD